MFYTQGATEFVVLITLSLILYDIHILRLSGTSGSGANKAQRIVRRATFSWVNNNPFQGSQHSICRRAA